MDEEESLVDRAVALLFSKGHTCSVRRAMQGAASVTEIGEAMAINHRSASDAVKAAEATLRAHGIGLDDDHPDRE